MPQVFYILFGALFCAAVAVAAGKTLLRSMGVSLCREEENGLAFITGAACLSMAVFALAAAHLVYKGVFLAIGAAVLANAWRIGAHRPLPDSLPPLRRKLLWIYAPAAAIFFVLTFCHAMAPEWSADGSSYHLGLVSRYYRARGFERLTTNMYANLSQGVEMLFLYAYSFGRQHSSAALTHFVFLLGLVSMMISYARRFGFANAGIGAALIVFVSPIVGVDAASAYNDLAIAAILFAVFYLVQIWDQTRQNALLAPIGLVAGFAFGSKYTAFLAIPYALGFILWKLRGRAVKPLLLVSAIAAAMIVPWLVKNIVFVSNPVSPFFNQWFPNPYVHISFEEEYKHHMTHYIGLESYSSIPLEVTVKGQILGGLLGPLFLLTPLGLLALGNSHGRRLWFAALLFGSVYATNVGTRFLIPSMPYIALAMALVFDRVKFLLPALVLAHSLSAWPYIIPRYADRWAWRMEEIYWRQALRMEPEESFLYRKWPPYGIARMIEKETQPNARILSFNQVSEAYMTRDFLVVYQSGEGGLLGSIMQQPLIPIQQPSRGVLFRFPSTSIRGVRVGQTAQGKPGEQWAVHEVRILNGGKEIIPGKNWQLKSSPNPWDVRDAFDNSPVTRWRSWETMRPGMYLLAAFNELTQADAVMVELSPDSVTAKLDLQWLASDGNWTPVRADPVEYEKPAPLGMRRAAMEELKTRGITHILLMQDEFGAADFEDRHADWGIRKAGEGYGARLYLIE